MLPAGERTDVEPPAPAAAAPGASPTVALEPARDVVADLLPAAPPGGVGLLDWLRLSGRGVATLGTLWSVWLLVATQISQAAAPSPVVDGLARGDWLSIEALGLHALGNGLPLWLLCALSVALGAGMFGLGPGTASGSSRRDGRVGGWLGLLAAAVWIAAIVATALVPPPRWLDLPIPTTGSPPVQSAQTLALEQGRWQGTALAGGSCTGNGDDLRCTLPEGGGPLAIGGGAVERDGLLWVLRGVQTDADAASGRLELDDALSNQGRVGFDVGPERATLVPALRARVALVGTRRTGPVLTARVGDGPAQLLAGPGLSTGPAVARLRAVQRVRLFAASPWPGRIGTLAAALTLLAVALAWRRSGAPKGEDGAASAVRDAGGDAAETADSAETVDACEVLAHIEGAAGATSATYVAGARASLGAP